MAVRFNQTSVFSEPHYLKLSCQCGIQITKVHEACSHLDALWTGA